MVATWCDRTGEDAAEFILLGSGTSHASYVIRHIVYELRVAVAVGVDGHLCGMERCGGAVHVV